MLCAPPPLPATVAPPKGQPWNTAAGTPAASAPRFSVSLSQVLLVWAAGTLALAVCLLHQRVRKWGVFEDVGLSSSVLKRPGLFAPHYGRGAGDMWPINLL